MALVAAANPFDNLPALAEKLSTTAIYTHVSMDRLRKAYDQATPV
jgi:site-specific recombinase XerC